MIYRLQSHRDSKIRVVIVTILLAILIFLGIFRSVAGTLLFWTLTPLSYFFDVTAWPAPFSSLSYDNRELSLKYEYVKAERDNLAGIKESYEILLQTFERESVMAQNISKGIYAPVVLRAPSSGFDVLVIGVGSKNGLNDQMLAVSENKNLMGKIAEVHDSYAKVTLYSKAGETQYMEVSRNKVVLSTEGHGAGTILTKVPKGTDIKEGDILTIPGLPLYPVARIEKVVATDADAYVTAYAMLIAPFATIDSIYAIPTTTY